MKTIPVYLSGRKGERFLKKLQKLFLKHGIEIKEGSLIFVSEQTRSSVEVTDMFYSVAEIESVIWLK